MKKNKMVAPRIIARLDIKAPNLIKGIHLEGLRVIGNPGKFANKYYMQGADELIYMDIVASLYERNSILDIVRETAKHIFIPMTVGGGIRSVSDVEDSLRAGADKTSINSAAVKRPELINEIANRFGSQCMVLSVEAKKYAPGKWEVYYDNGREKTGLDVMEWIKDAEKRGAGEVLLTSVDMEGTGKGFDYELIKLVANAINIPVIASGGCGSLRHAVDAVNIANADAIALGHVLHYDKCNINEIKEAMRQADIEVRQ